MLKAAMIFLDKVPVTSEQYAIVGKAALVVAALLLLNMLLTVLGNLFRYFIRPGVNLHKYGKWVAVTGCTDGIGKAYCELLARTGFNLVMISRSEDKLKEFEKDLKAKHKNIETRTIPADLSSNDDGVWTRITTGLSGIDLGVLINNAAVSYDHAEFLHLVDDATVDRLIAVNVAAVTRLTRIALRVMLEKKSRGKKGAIVNIGSGAATVLPSDPLYAVYAGTKAYVDQMTQCLSLEYKEKGIDFQLQAPLYVATKMSKIRSASLTAPSPKTYAAAGLKAIGYEARSTPYWIHDIMWGLIRRAPASWVNAYRLKMCLDFRRRAYKRKEREAVAGDKKGN